MDPAQHARPWERRAGGDGTLLIRLSWAGTIVSCATAALNAVTGSREEYLLSAIPALLMLLGGSVAMLWAFAVAVERSRHEVISVGGLYFLAGCAPASVQRTMLASLAVQSVVPLAITIVRPFVAFSVLAPVWALGLAGLWGALHGTFPARNGASDPESVADGPECGPHDPRTEAPTDG